MRAAYALAEQALPTYSCKFSRHDYSLPQLFACLTMREMFNLSYRGTEACSATVPTGWRTSGSITLPITTPSAARSASSLRSAG